MDRDNKEENNVKNRAGEIDGGACSLSEQKFKGRVLRFCRGGIPLKRKQGYSLGTDDVSVEISSLVL
jgi:hypothetical protein